MIYNDASPDCFVTTRGSAETTAPRTVWDKVTNARLALKAKAAALDARLDAFGNGLEFASERLSHAIDTKTEAAFVRAGTASDAALERAGQRLNRAVAKASRRLGTAIDDSPLGAFFERMPFGPLEKA